MKNNLRNRRINKKNTKKKKNYMKKTQKGYGGKKISVCNTEKKQEIESLYGLVRLEFKDNKYDKFWQIITQGNKTISTNGRIGSDRPRQTVKQHDSDEIAKQFVVSEICSKLDEGYVIVKEKSSERIPIDKLSEKSQLEKLERERQEIENKIKKTKEAIKEEEKDKETKQIENLQKEIQGLDREISGHKKKIEEINEHLIPLLQRKVEAENNIKDILKSQQREKGKEEGENKETQLKKSKDLEHVLEEEGDSEDLVEYSKELSELIEKVEEEDEEDAEQGGTKKMKVESNY
jgi:predicted DNA-binding WGR domain protein